MDAVKNLKDLAELNLQNPRVNEFINTIIQKTGNPEDNFKQWFFKDLLEELGYLLGSEHHLEIGDIDHAYRIGSYGIGFEEKPPLLIAREGVFSYKDSLQKHLEQVEKYLGSPELHFLVLTDGINWYFYSKKSLKSETEYFLSLKTLQLLHPNSDHKLEELHYSKIVDTIRRWEDESYKESLDERFYKALKLWMDQIQNDIKGKVVPKTKDVSAEAVNFVNKLIFIRTLEDIGALPYNYLRNELKEKFHKWRKLDAAKKLLEETNEWIYKHYDTELFTQNNIFISPEVWEFLILGNISPITGVIFNPCLYDFNFSIIDFDVLGHVYEQYLAELKKERGIYYTRRLIVEYIVSKTVGKKAKEIVQEAITLLQKGDFERSKKIMNDNFFGLKILDPAPGSGSFLICAFDQLSELYQNWQDEYIYSYNEANKENSIPLFKEWARGKDVFDDWKEKIVLSCLHGCDLDAKAVGVAKLNLWLRLIRTNPDQYYWKNLQEKNILHALPNLSLNIITGNSLLGINRQETIQEISKEYSEDWKEIKELEKEYKKNFKLDSRIVEKVLSLKEKIRNHLRLKLNKQSRKNYPELELSQTATFWNLEFPFGEFDFVIGNPPYIGEEDHKELFRPIRNTSLIGEFYEGKMDYWYFFCHLGITFLKEGGEISFIVPHYWPTAEGAKRLIQRIVKETKIEELFDFNEYKVFKESAPGQHNMVFRFKKTKELGYPVVSRIIDLRITEDKLKEAFEEKEVAEVERFIAGRQDRLLDSSGKLYFSPKQVTNVCDIIQENTDIRLGGREGICDINQGIVSGPDQINSKILKKILLSEGVLDPTEEQIMALEQKLKLKRHDEVFVISHKTLDKLRLNKKEKGVIRPFFWASDIEPYFTDPQHESYIIYSTKDTIENIEDFPNLRSHLKRFKSVTELRRETKEGKNKWFHLHWPRRTKIFESLKIIGVRQTDIPTFAYVEIPYYVSMACNIITKKEDAPKKVSLQAITAVLNSQLAHFWFYHRGKRKGELLQIDGKPLEDFPIRIPNTAIAQKLELLAKNITKLKTFNYQLLKEWFNGTRALFGNSTTSVKEYLRSYSMPVLTKSTPVDSQTKLLDFKIALANNMLCFYTNQGLMTYKFKNASNALHLLYSLSYQFFIEKKKNKLIEKIWEIEIPYKYPTIFKEISVQNLFKELAIKFGKNSLNLSKIQKKIKEDEDEINLLVAKLYKVEDKDLSI